MPDDPLTAALKMSFGGVNGQKGSFFSAARTFASNDRNELQDMLNQSPETQFLGKPQPTPTPTPTPSAVKPSQMSLSHLYGHFGVERYVSQSNRSGTRPMYQPRPASDTSLSGGGPSSGFQLYYKGTNVPAGTTGTDRYGNALFPI